MQVAYGYGLFTGGLGLHYGAEALGAAVIPMSGGNTEKQLMIMRDFGSTQIACTPSYAMYLGEALEASGIDRSEIRLKSGIFGAEPWSDSLRKKIEAKLGIKAYDIYGLSEIMGPGVAIECAEQNGLHVWEDNFIAEIIDPDTLQPVPDGVEGELVVTTITKEGIPLLRYRTRDISKITREKSACGRTHARIARIKARTDDMLIIRGVNVFPSQIESVLLTIDAVAPHYAIIVTREGTLDMIEVQVELNEKSTSTKFLRLKTLQKRSRISYTRYWGSMPKSSSSNRTRSAALKEKRAVWSTRERSCKHDEASIGSFWKTARAGSYKLLEILKKNDINILSLTIADTVEYGVARLIVSDLDKALKALGEGGMTVSQTEVVAIEVGDESGGLYDATKLMAAHGINIEYMYSAVRSREGRAVIIMRVDDVQKTKDIIKANENGLRLTEIK